MKMNTPMVINNPPNIFNAESVHRDLEDNRDLWEHAFYIYQTVGVYGQADCEVENINYYLLVAPGMEAQLINLVSRWKPGKAEWASMEERKRFDVLNTKPSLQKPKTLKVTWVV
jgi:hypothetical protein